MIKILDILFGKHPGEFKNSSLEKKVLLHKYDHFKALLNENNKALAIITDLEHIFYEDQPVSWNYIQTQAERLIETVCRIAEDLNALSRGAFLELFEVVEKITLEIQQGLERKKTVFQTALILPLERVNQSHINEVGAKAANLGEILNRVKLPVPQGFAVTAFACQHYMEYNHFPKEIENKLKNLDVNDTEQLMLISQEIRSLILTGEIPPDLEKAFLQALRDLKNKTTGPIRLAVRSSATSEDTEASFAGQHSTVLNVGESNLPGAYKEVVASTFNPRAIFYRRSKGYLDQDVIMSVACITMVDALTSGVMYTMDPNDSRHDVILISALWGLGVSLVDGSLSADFYQVNKSDRKIEIEDIVRKDYRFFSHPGGGDKKRSGSSNHHG